MVYRLVGNVCVLMLCGTSTAILRAQDLIYENPVDVDIQGRVVEQGNGLTRTFPDELSLDFNRDGVLDLRFRHELVPNPQQIDTQGIRLLRFAEDGISTSLDVVLGMRRLAITAANEGVLDANALARIQSQIDHGLRFLNRNAEAVFADGPVLDGSYGLQVNPSHDNVVPISAEKTTSPGSYSIVVPSAAERARILAGEQQTMALANDEALALNNVTIELNEGMTQHQVVDRINDFQPQTGVLAGIDSFGYTLLYSEAFGTNAQIRVVSNVSQAANSSGFGDAWLTAVGADVVAEIDGNSYTGSGDIVVATGGSEEGLSFRIQTDAFDPTVTVSGALGSVNVTNNAPVFVTDEKTGKSASIEIPNVRPSALGMNVTGNQFAGLQEIKVLSSVQARQSLQIIDQALEELQTHDQDIREFLATNALPYGVSSVEGLYGSEFALSDSGLLAPGIEVGTELSFRDGEQLLHDSSVLQVAGQKGFVGVRISVPDGWMYGWVGVEIDNDSALTISDYAWNLLPNENVITGAASNRPIPSLLPGDANVDGKVGFQDFLILSNNFGQAGGWQHGDFNFDRQVDFADFLSLSTNYGTEAKTVNAPEPLSRGLLCVAAIFLVTCRLSRSQPTEALVNKGLPFAVCLIVCCGFEGTARTETLIYSDPEDISVVGDVVNSSDGLFRVFPKELDLDVNHDGISDLRFRHSLMPRPERIDSEALQLMQSAEQGIAESLHLVAGFRSLAIKAANEAVNDQDALAAFQAQIDNGLDTIDRISRLRSHKGLPLLDGTFGLSGVPSHESVIAISATQQTKPDSYSIEVSQPATRASVDALTKQAANLAEDEVVVVNGILIELHKNMNLQQVIDRFNDFSSLTGVNADVGEGGATRLYTAEFGANSFMNVIANRPAAVDSSGFGHEERFSRGTDIVASIGPNAYTGYGATVIATGGNEKGLAFRVHQESSDPITTATGRLGTIDVVDRSPSFVTNTQTGEVTSFTIPNIQPSALGLGVASNQFVSLETIRVQSPAQAGDSLTIIDVALEELQLHHDEIVDFLSFTALPYGVGTIEGLAGSEYSVGDFGLLPAGVEVGPDLLFEKGQLRLQDSQVFRDIEQSGFVGTRIPIHHGWLYGWVGIEVDGDSSIRISDYAWNLVPNETVVTGVASHRTFESLLLGDADLDGVVGFQDFLVFSANFGRAGSWQQGDFNFDQQVDFKDFLVLSNSFGTDTKTANVPEPSSSTLLMMILLGLVIHPPSISWLSRSHERMDCLHQSAEWLNELGTSNI